MKIGLNSDTGTVNWKYENTLYSYVVEGIIFAAESNDIIYLEIYENKTFRYRPRGLYDCEFPYEPYPEVISYEKLQDGTLKLTIEAVWEIRMLDQAITSELMIKPMEDGSFQYLSNKVISSDQNANAGWYMPRLTEEEWEENYSNN